VEDLSNAINSEDLDDYLYFGNNRKTKGVMLTHNNIVSNVLGSIPRIPKKKSLDYKDTRVLSFLPICHILKECFSIFSNTTVFHLFRESIEKMGENVKEVNLIT
jgi:long-chain acyl-CoA synthetase